MVSLLVLRTRGMIRSFCASMIFPIHLTRVCCPSRRPDLAVKKRRGGKRMRRWKERFEETAMMKQANTQAFSSQQGEYGDDAMGITMGLLDTADSGGAIRKTTEKRKMGQANTKASRKRAMQMASRAQNKDGLASSSMELVNPDANKDRVRQANRKWFDGNAGFQSALPRNNP
jgi:U4/U6 small nuclear ribonucleoprotein PRP31